LFFWEIFIYRKFQFGTFAYIGNHIVYIWKNLSNKTKHIVEVSAIYIFSVPFSVFCGSFIFYTFLKIFSFDENLVAYDPFRYGLIVGIIILYFLILTEQKIFPPCYLWKKMKFVPRRFLSSIFKSEKNIKFSLWFLHLFVAYVFAFSLLGFLSANLNTIIEYLLPNDISFTLLSAKLTQPLTIIDWFINTIHNISLITMYGFAQLSVDHVFAILRLSLWSITISGCLVGYLHSVIKIGSLTSIRNIDFTVLGWFTNAVCYGSLLGSVLWRIAPSPEGALPVINSGPLFYVMLVVEFLLNLLYSASILNMFTKFGVMVDKGLVTSGFFNIIRHPNYTIEFFMFLALFVRGFSTFTNVFGVGFYFLIYWLRSEREEVFMEASNPGYAQYKKDVPYKYIRGLI